MLKLFGGQKAQESLSIELAGRLVALATPPSVYDACLFVPVVRALQSVCGGLDLVVPESLEGFWRKMGGEVQLTVYPDTAEAKEIAVLMRDLGKPYEVSLAWDPSPVAEAFAKMKVGQRVGYDVDGLSKVLTDPLVYTDEPGRHGVHHYLDLLKMLGVDGFVGANFQTPPLPARGERPRIALVPGSEMGSGFRWGMERFAEVAERLERECGAELIILSLPGRVNEANELATRLGEGARNFANHFDLVQLMDALPFCSLIISNDCALPLLAGLAGVPAVVMYGPSDAEVQAPFGGHHTLLSEKVECSPCHEMACPYDHHKCMENLQVERVFNAAAQYLSVPVGV